MTGGSGRSGRSGPSAGRQIAVGVAFLLVDLVVVGYLLFLRHGMTSWADAYDAGNPPDAPGEALRGMWILLGGAVVTGGGLVLLRWRIAGVVQLVVLGGAAGLLGGLAAR
ncbi:DUF6234 family protein [Streptomyces sp. NPDC006193]|uniref:DUF6234 family protein n=1 Tax=Streptomyces sp. NPDC006193 TaxID=3155717 RepID=UPI0033BD44D1